MGDNVVLQVISSDTSCKIMVSSWGSCLGLNLGSGLAPRDSEWNMKGEYDVKGRSDMRSRETQRTAVKSINPRSQSHPNNPQWHIRRDTRIRIVDPITECSRSKNDRREVEFVSRYSLYLCFSL